MKFEKIIIATLATVGTLATISQGWALEPWKASGYKKFWPDCVEKFCCDDYQAKPLPCAAGVKCFECPDYCPKPLPCAAPVNAFCCDDYCRKRLPPVCCPSDKTLRCIPSWLPPVDVTDRKKLTVKSMGWSPTVIITKTPNSLPR